MGRQFFKRLERWEQRLQIIVILLFSLLVVLQMFMAKDPLRFYLSFAEQMEGVPLYNQDMGVAKPGQEQNGEIKIKMHGYFVLPRVVILINGSEVASFQEREISLAVQAGDEITIDGTAYPYPITFQVSAVSQGVSWPPINYQVSTDNSRVSLGKVKMK